MKGESIARVRKQQELAGNNRLAAFRERLRQEHAPYTCMSGLILLQSDPEPPRRTLWQWITMQKAHNHG